ncbi:MAG: hypothetical protein AMXMBFR23_18680 [Chloroflexota bacterium]
MSLTTASRRRAAALAGLAALGLLMAACGGDSKKVITAEQAPTVAEAALIAMTDLPASEWEDTTDESAGEDSATDGLFAESPACQQFDAAFEGVAAGTSVEPLAEATRNFSSGNMEALVMREVQSQIAVMPEDFDTAARVAEIKGLFTAEALQPCFEEAFAAAFGAEVTINSLTVTNPTVTANDDAGAVAVDLAALAVILPINVHMEVHFWSEGQVGATLLFLEMNSDLVQTGRDALVQAAAKRVTDAIAAAE